MENNTKKTLNRIAPLNLRHIGVFLTAIPLTLVHTACGLEPPPSPIPWSEQCWDTEQKPDLSGCTIDTELEDNAGVCANKVCVPLSCDKGNGVDTSKSSFPLPDTRQELCYDGENSLGENNCPLPDADYYGQDAQYGLDAEPVYDSDRFELDTSFVGEPTVKDTVTGMVWQRCPAGHKGNDCLTPDNSVSEKQNRGDAGTYCEDLDWGGYTDWFLPDNLTLESIMDLGKAQAPLIDEIMFPIVPDREDFATLWSSSTLEDGTRFFHVNFENGEINYDFNNEGSEYAVRCVRMSQNGITKLNWQRCTTTNDSEEEYQCVKLAWKEALTYCEMLTWDGTEEWRLPNRRELMSVFDEFHREMSDDFWSSTSVAYSDGSGSKASSAWVVSFHDGKVVYHNKEDKYYVRCVRKAPQP